MIDRKFLLEQFNPILISFRDIFHINSFLIAPNGQELLAADLTKDGGELLTQPTPQGFGWIQNPDSFIKSFTPKNNFRALYNSTNKLNLFAIPIQISNKEPVGYLIVGPVNFDQKNSRDNIRMVTEEWMDLILDLLAGIIKNNLEAILKQKEFDTLCSAEFLKRHSQLKPLAHEIYSTIYWDELLGIFLNTALKITESEGGSVFIKDQKTKNLTLKVSRGLNFTQGKQLQIKLGKGLAGLAAENNETFVINAKRTNPRIKHLLKRSDIKESAIIPLVAQKKVFGVLNIHSKRHQKIESNLPAIKDIVQLISTTA